MKKTLAVLLLAVLALAGCHLDPMNARDGVVSAYGFIADLQTKHLASCQAAPQQAPCVAINRGVALQRVAATALNEYCAGPALPGQATYADGGPCSAQAGLQPRLELALRDLNSIMEDLKKLGGN